MIVEAACSCARLVLQYIKPGEQVRPLTCIETAEAWARGEATIDQVREARNTAYAYADAASDGTVYAAAAAASSAAYDAASAYAYAADAAVYAADAAVYAASGAAADVARREMRISCCDAIRRVIPLSTLMPISA